MKDEASFCLVGAVKKTFVNDKKTFAVLSLETSVDGFRTVHELKAFKDYVGYIGDLQVGEVVEICGNVGKMGPKDCEYAKIPGKPSQDGTKTFYPAIPVLQITSIRRDPRIAGQTNAEDDDNVPD